MSFGAFVKGNRKRPTIFLIIRNNKDQSERYITCIHSIIGELATPLPDSPADFQAQDVIKTIPPFHPVTISLRDHFFSMCSLAEMLAQNPLVIFQNESWLPQSFGLRIGIIRELDEISSPHIRKYCANFVASLLMEATQDWILSYSDSLLSLCYPMLKKKYTNDLFKQAGGGAELLIKIYKNDHLFKTACQNNSLKIQIQNVEKRTSFNLFRVHLISGNLLFDIDCSTELISQKYREGMKSNLYIQIKKGTIIDRFFPSKELGYISNSSFNANLLDRILRGYFYNELLFNQKEFPLNNSDLPYYVEFDSADPPRFTQATEGFYT